MKNIWKVLGITALAASLIPYRVNKDDETESTTLDALLWQATRRPGEGEDKGSLDISIGFKSPLQTKREESALFADDEPEAAVVDAPLTEIVEEAVEEAVEDVIAGAEDEETAEPTEEDFDPEL